MFKLPHSYITFIQFKDCTQKEVNGCKIWICPKCKNHKLGRASEFFDCKEIIYDDELDKDGKLQGGNTQCGCYSKEHGIKKIL